MKDILAYGLSCFAISIVVLTCCIGIAFLVSAMRSFLRDIRTWRQKRAVGRESRHFIDLIRHRRIDI